MAATILTGTPTPFTPGASTTSTDENSLLRILQQAEAVVAKLQQHADRSGNADGAVIVSLSAQARQIGSLSLQSAATQGTDLVTQWRNALGDRHKADLSALAQLQALNKQMHSSRHDDASLRLQQLLAQYHALRMFGGSAKALADLAKQIKAAANDLSASGDTGSGDPSTDPAGANVTSTPADAAGTTTAGATATGAAADGAAAADALDTGTAAAIQPASDAAVPVSAPADQGASARPSTSGETNAANPPQGQPADTVWQQLIQQVNVAGARAQRKANDELLLEQARAAISQIERMAKHAEEDKRHKVAVHLSGNAGAPDPAPAPAVAGSPAAARVRSSAGLDKVI